MRPCSPRCPSRCKTPHAAHLKAASQEGKTAVGWRVAWWTEETVTRASMHGARPLPRTQWAVDEVYRGATRGASKARGLVESLKAMDFCRPCGQCEAAETADVAGLVADHCKLTPPTCVHAQRCSQLEQLWPPKASLPVYCRCCRSPERGARCGLLRHSICSGRHPPNALQMPANDCGLLSHSWLIRGPHTRWRLSRERMGCWEGGRS